MLFYPIPTSSKPDPAHTCHSIPIGPRPPQTPAAHYKPLYRKCSGPTCLSHCDFLRRSTSDKDLALYGQVDQLRYGPKEYTAVSVKLPATSSRRRPRAVRSKGTVRLSF